MWVMTPSRSRCFASSIEVVTDCCRSRSSSERGPPIPGMPPARTPGDGAGAGAGTGTGAGTMPGGLVLTPLCSADQRRLFPGDIASIAIILLASSDCIFIIILPPLPGGGGAASPPTGRNIIDGDVRPPAAPGPTGDPAPLPPPLPPATEGRGRGGGGAEPLDRGGAAPPPARGRLPRGPPPPISATGLGAGFGAGAGAGSGSASGSGSVATSAATSRLVGDDGAAAPSACNAAKAIVAANGVPIPGRSVTIAPSLGSRTASSTSFWFISAIVGSAIVGSAGSWPAEAPGLSPSRWSRCLNSTSFAPRVSTVESASNGGRGGDCPGTFSFSASIVAGAAAAA